MPNSGREPKRDRTRAIILDRALTLFAAQGFDDTTMADIAAAAGVVRQTVLNHFPRKEDLVLAWGERRRRQLSKVEVAEQSVIAGVHALYSSLAAINERERKLTKQLEPVFQLVAGERTVPPALLALIAAGQRDGTFDPELDSIAAGQVLTAVYFDTLTRWLAGADDAPLGPLLAERVDVVLHGLLGSADT